MMRQKAWIGRLAFAVVVTVGPAAELIELTGLRWG
jgi:hypothetical protein